MVFSEIFTGISAELKNNGLSAVIEWENKVDEELERLRADALQAAEAYKKSREDARAKITEKISALLSEDGEAEEKKKAIKSELVTATARDDKEGFKTAQKKLEKLETEKAVRADMVNALRQSVIFGDEELYRTAEEKHNAYNAFAQQICMMHGAIVGLAREQEGYAKQIIERADSYSRIGGRTSAIIDGFNSIAGENRGEQIKEEAAPKTGNVFNGHIGSYKIDPLPTPKPKESPKS